MDALEKILHFPQYGVVVFHNKNITDFHLSWKELGMILLIYTMNISLFLEYLPFPINACLATILVLNLSYYKLFYNIGTIL